MGQGFFTQARWYVAHTCAWREPNRIATPNKGFESRLGALMSKERRA
jgi:hypothetical protein